MRRTQSFRLLIVIFLVVFTFAGDFALSSGFSPKAGDQAHYSQTFVRSGRVIRTEVKRKVLRAEDGRQFLVSMERDDGQYLENWYPLPQMGYIQNIDDYCRRFSKIQFLSENYKREILTIPAGTFETCRVTSYDGRQITWWAAGVPFGVIRELHVFDRNDIFEQTISQYQNQ